MTLPVKDGLNSGTVSKKNPARSLRGIPAVEKVLQALGSADFPRPVVVNCVRQELAQLRSELNIPDFDETMDRVRKALDRLRLARIQPVINGTGIIVHTNLGRAPLGPEVVRTLSMAASEYNNLEYDLSTGERGARAQYVEECLALLCEGEAAAVVNNCAAALVLILRHFTSGDRPEVIISRGELVQIGGGFRIPEILEASGARLREVGTTNKTSLKDYERAIGASTGLILKVHRSNFFMDGFVESPATENLSELARNKNVPFVEDLGSGAMVATESAPGVEHEPTPAEILGRGVDLVCFSGDKLLGGPQAGIIAGKANLVRALKQEPFFRALRCDKLILAAMQATAELYLARPRESGNRSVPVVNMMQESKDTLRARAEKLIEVLGGLPAEFQIGEGKAQLGGGTLPRSIISSVTLDMIPSELSLQKLSERLRRGIPPVIGYVSGKRFKLDLRTIFPEQDPTLITRIRESFGAPGR